MLFLVFSFYVIGTGGITDESKRLFMEADIDPIGAKAIPQEGEGRQGYGGGVGQGFITRCWGSV